MHKVIIPAIVMIIFIAGMVGPDGPVTGLIAVKAMLGGVGSYIGICISDWLFERRGRELERS